MQVNGSEKMKKKKEDRYKEKIFTFSKRYTFQTQECGIKFFVFVTNIFTIRPCKIRSTKLPFFKHIIR